MEVFTNYVDNLSRDEKISLVKYTSFCSRPNTFLRLGKKLIGPDEKFYRTILNIFTNGPKVTEPLKVYRGSKGDDCTKYSSFISTTLDIEVAKTFIDAYKEYSYDEEDSYEENEEEMCCLYEITLPPGSYTYLPLMKISQHPNEIEILLPPGSLHTTGRSGNTITCVYLPQISHMLDIMNSYINDSDPLTIDEWIYKIKGDLGKRYAKLVELTKGNMSLGENDLMNTLAKLSYYNDIPEEAFNAVLYNYDEDISIKFKKLHTSVLDKYESHLNRTELLYKLENFTKELEKSSKLSDFPENLKKLSKSVGINMNFEEYMKYCINCDSCKDKYTFVILEMNANFATLSEIQNMLIHYVLNEKYENKCTFPYTTIKIPIQCSKLPNIIYLIQNPPTIYTNINLNNDITLRHVWKDKSVYIQITNTDIKDLKVYINYITGNEYINSIGQEF